jgi:hypothetical protein
MDDHNTRIVMGSTTADAHYVAEALTREAFHNVSVYGKPMSEALEAIRR